MYIPFKNTERLKNFPSINKTATEGAFSSEAYLGNIGNSIQIG